MGESYFRANVIFNLSDLNEEDLSKKLINKILFKYIIDDGKSCDCIFVPAIRSGNKYRTPVAVEQYFLG
jgi:hypothetical protein